MRTQTIFLAIVTAWMILSTSLPVNVTMLFALTPALAQTPNQRKVEADRLLKQGYELRAQLIYAQYAMQSKPRLS
jgi:hypothetical protein